jgi:putative aminopeptidase FrvX
MIEIKDVFANPANNKSETKRAFYIIETLKNMGLSPEVDLYGNIMVTKGKAKQYPTFCCHMDTVHAYSNGFNLVEQDGCLFAVDDKDKQVGVGGDRRVVSL